MELADLLINVNVARTQGNATVPVTFLCFDSRKVRPGCMFVAIRGTEVDGHQFIDSAIKNGAKVIVCEEIPCDAEQSATYIQVDDASAALGKIASNFYGNPSHQLKLVGVTGTNGKTTTATLLFQIFRAIGYNVGLLSTINTKINEKVFDSTHTTPDALRLNALLRDMVDQGCTYCFMEVSSHAIHQNRIAGVAFTGAIFTNLSHDHIDYHKTMEAYFQAKKKFFDSLDGAAFALSNLDDTRGLDILRDTMAKPSTFGINAEADFTCEIIENRASGLSLNIDGQKVALKLIGRFNAYNALGVYAASIMLGEEGRKIRDCLSQIEPVEGRFEYVTSQNVVGIIDYAHSPDALQNVLFTIKDIKPANGRVITLMGCGGNRDKEKRPIMAQMACKNSDVVILTSDNPRFEDPQAITGQIAGGVPADAHGKTQIILDRREAIKAAVSLARSGDIVLIAGKGHEKYQEIDGVKHPFDDKEELRKAFVALEQGGR